VIQMGLDANSSVSIRTELSMNSSYINKSEDLMQYLEDPTSDVRLEPSEFSPQSHKLHVIV
jgi:hypothetical protein